MTTDEWNEKFGEEFVITLTDEERRYFALNPIDPAWETAAFYSKTNSWYTRVTAFFDGDTIVKVIQETKTILSSGILGFEEYREYDTSLSTENRALLLPLTSCGKPKKLSASNITTVTPFGCCFVLYLETGKDTLLGLYNPRANKEFPVGEWDAVAAIRSDEDFHIFAQKYIETCREDYFNKLHTFKTAQKMTIKYKPGDIFRMEYDRTRYCYGIITGEVRQFLKMPDLPEKHSLRTLMMIPILIRMYRLITENPNLTAKELREVPLGRVGICGDNDIIWGTHTIVDHKQLEPNDLEFNFVCTQIVTDSPHIPMLAQGMLMRDSLLPKREYTLYIEWGFAQTSLRYEQISDKLKALMENYTSPHSGCGLSIDPRNAVPDEKRRQGVNYRNNLLNPENREFLNEIFACLGLGEDTTFDQFAEKFGGLTLSEIAARMADKKR